MSNNFLPFGVAGGANVIDQATFAALPARLQGFVAGVALSAQLNKVWRQSSVMSAMIGEFIQDYGGLDALDDGDIDKLEREFVRSIQAGKYAFAIATGTANAWAIAPDPAIAAYTLGRSLKIRAPATNTSTTVNANISTLGNRRIKKRDGSDPAIGDLVANCWYETIDDGTSIIVLGSLPSDVLATPGPVAAAVATQQMAHVIGGLSTLWPFNTLSVISFTADRQFFRDPGTTFSAGVLTPGPLDAGLWLVNAWTNFQRTDTTLNWGYITVNGGQQAVSGDTGAGSASGSNAVVSQAVILSAGDVLRTSALQQNAASQSQNLVSRVSMYRLSA